MYCSNCSVEIAEGSKFCPKCGTATAAPSVENSKNEKKRHGFTTFWLIAGIIFFSMMFFFSIIMPIFDPGFSRDVIATLLSAVLIVGYVLVLHWRHFGFIIIVIATVIDVIVVIYTDGGLLDVLGPLVLLGLLYCVLLIRKDGKSTWAQLK